MDSGLIDECKMVLRESSPTGARRQLLIARLEGAKDAWVKAAERLEAIAKSHLAQAREYDLFLEIFREKDK